jgi:pyridoxine 5'-phosphate synthase PdxJ
MTFEPQAVLSILLGLIFGLIGLVYRNISVSLEAKASNEALKETKEYFRKELERVTADYSDRVKDLAARQDREIDSIRTEMGRITDGLEVLRRDVSQGNTSILERLQEVALQIQHTRVAP